ncbi:MAG: hypothetical protein IPJ20_24255 [Flammeovirgaceae bacterium]|nr:hypothetical protein [Flammeovirgaceae bacterium]
MNLIKPIAIILYYVIINPCRAGAPAGGRGPGEGVNRKTKADLLFLNLQIQKQKEELSEQAKNLANANSEITSMNINPGKVSGGKDLTNTSTKRTTY